MEVRILGEVHCAVDGVVVDVPSSSQRRLLASLAVHAPRPVRSEWLCAIMAITPGALRQSVARLRRSVGETLIRTSATGYQLVAAVDAVLVETELGLAGDDPTAIATVLERWTGPSIAEFADEDWAAGSAARLDELRATIVESYAEALIDAERFGGAIGILEGHIVDHPFRDHPRGLLIRSLAADGRQTEALRAYTDYRSFLADQVGVEPSDQLHDVERRVAAGWDGRRTATDAPTTAATESHTSDRRPRWPSPPPLPDAFATAARCVGRHAEISALTEAAERVVSEGHLGVVLVSGEAGIGKTTLAAEFARRQTGAGRSVWFGRCDELADEPLQPFRKVLSQLAAALPDEVMAAHTAACGGDLLPAVPDLDRRLPATATRRPGDEIVSRLLLFEAACDLMRRAAELGPMVVVIDDLHWAEPTGLQLLRHLVRNLANRPVLVLACFRDTGEADGDDVRSALAELSRSGALRLELTGLDTTELGDLARARDDALTEHVDVAPVVAVLQSESAGNPLYAEQLLRHYAVSGQLRVDGGLAIVNRDGTEVVPSSLRDLVWHRVRALGPWGQSVLAAAAVLGTGIDESIVHLVSDIDQEMLTSVLDRGVAAGVLLDDPEAPGSLRFAHALVARAIEDDLGPRERARLHRRAFDLLVDDPTARPSRIARHADRSGLVADALRWAIRAGDRALDDLTPDEAAVWFDRALDYADRLNVADGERAGVLTGLGEALYRAGHPSAIDALHAAAELALRASADATLMRAALAIEPGSIRLGAMGPRQLAIAEAALARSTDTDPDTRARILAILARSLVPTDQHGRRRDAAHDALELARRSSDVGLLALIAPDLLFALWEPGAADERVQIARDAVRIVESLGSPRQAANLYHAAYTAAVCACDADFARLCADRLRSLADEIGEPRVRWLALLIDGFEATMQCRFDEAERIIESCRELGEQIGESETFTAYAAQFFTLASHRGWRGEMHMQMPDHLDTTESIQRTFEIGFAIVSFEGGAFDSARMVLDAALERGLDTIPPDFMKSSLLIGLAILAIGLSDDAAAELLLEQLAPSAGEVSYNMAMSQGPTSIYVGRLSTIARRFDDAERSLHSAIAVSERFGWVFHRVAALHGLVENRLAAAGRLDADSERWLIEAESTAAELGLDDRARQLEGLRAQLADRPNVR